MAYEFRLPDIGEGVAEGEVVQWFVKEGQTIREDQPLVQQPQQLRQITAIS